MTHALLHAAPVNNGPRLQQAELRAMHLLLLFHEEDGGLAEHDAVDGLRGSAGGARHKRVA